MANEKYLTLTDGRTLAYEDVGDQSSSLVILFFHGVFGIGSAPASLSPVFVEKRAHYIAPTLAGWGDSSPRSASMSYAVALTSDMTALIMHLHPNTSNLRIYVAGGSYGTVPAQILYGAPFDMFPLGRHVVGCFLAAPFSPFRWHKDYTKSMTWQNYISVGPPSRIVPFQIIPRMAVWALSMKLSSVDQAEAFLRSLLFDSVLPEERAAHERWRVSRGLEPGVFERQMATNMVKSIAKSWAGFIEASEVIHSDWGFCPKHLDEEHTVDRPLLISASEHDDLGPDMANWLQTNYRNAKLKWIHGKHLSTLYVMDELWAEMLVNEPAPLKEEPVRH
ncbi:Alpha/Beta hydrolase protein [Mycena sp. CBHHK59/15]|nr:Alpha/Beta hydrolase protein [Mycena sp. CBHHK59/15]